MFLSAEKVSKKFNRTKDGASWFYAVRETDISIDQGTLTAIFGKSGSGKRRCSICSAVCWRRQRAL